MIRSIPLKYHLLEDGNWLDTLEDDALQACFLELATINRISYVPWINYYRNVNYGSNDNSNREKIQHRADVFEYVLQLPMLSPLKDVGLGNQDINAAWKLKKDIGK